MNELMFIEDIKIENMIYEIRGQYVMLDSDLALLYGVTTGNLNKAKNRNINRFPSEFCFRLTKEEYINLKFQNGISKIDGRKLNRGLPFVFTEEGVAMLSSVLKSKIAEEISVRIMKTFVKMRKFITINNNYNDRISNLETKYIEHDSKIDILFDKLSSKEKNNHVFFDGTIYDSYSFFMDILGKAKEEIIIIDNYAGKELFDILRNINVNIKIYTKNIDDISMKKYNSQYNNITIMNNDIFHDRFIILDKNILYHCDSSFKDLGKKCFSINKIEDTSIIDSILNKL